MVSSNFSIRENGNGSNNNNSNNNDANNNSNSEVTTLSWIDSQFRPLACLGHGGFGSVFLAQKRSGRKVAIKFMRCNTRMELGHGSDGDDDDVGQDESMFSRELEAVLKLDDCNNTHEDADTADANKTRSLGLVHFEDWYHDNFQSFACIVMNYADGGTLAQDIVNQANNKSEPYTERRIAYYALQLASALAYAHERGVAHHDVKSSNVLLDKSNGDGKLLLADFGSAVGPGEESVRFSEIYASPELQRAHVEENYGGLEPTKIDAFGLGCILYEMLSCQRLVELSQEKTLAEFLQDAESADAALFAPVIQLGWLPPKGNSDRNAADITPTVGYSHVLYTLVKSLLEPNPAVRWTPSQVETPLRNDPRSPLLEDWVSAAQPLRAGAPVTMDNIQLGMFVQKGRDWTEEDNATSMVDDNAVGVVVKLDADAGYTDIAFPPPSSDKNVNQKPFSPRLMTVRIGARNKFELQVGPTPANNIKSGLVYNAHRLINGKGPSYAVGQVINEHMVVSIVEPTPHSPDQKVLLAPLKRISVPRLPFTLDIHPREPGEFVQARKPMPEPEYWSNDNAASGINPQPDLTVEVIDDEEKRRVLKYLFAPGGGFETQLNQIISIKRFQQRDLWRIYAEKCEQVALENWGIVNEKFLFHGTKSSNISPEIHLQNATISSSEDTSSAIILESLFNQSHTAYCSCLPPEFEVNEGDAHFSEHASFGHRLSYEVIGDENDSYPCTSAGMTVHQIILSRVALGRIDNQCGHGSNTRPSRYHLDCHSSQKNSPLGPVYCIKDALQHYPEYIITYANKKVRQRRILRTRSSPSPNVVTPREARHQSADHDPSSATTSDAVIISPFPQQTTPTPGTEDEEPSTVAKTSIPDVKQRGGAQDGNKPRDNSKMCVVCWDHAVSHVLIPCGHPCLCNFCANRQGLAKLKSKCPVCRTKIRNVIRLYGRVVED